MGQNGQKMMPAARDGGDRVPGRHDRPSEGPPWPESWPRAGILPVWAAVPPSGETDYGPARIEGVFGGPMKDDRVNGDGKAGTDARDPRRDRLKAALRENLKRRKSQARGRDDLASSERADASLDDAGGEEPGP